VKEFLVLKCLLDGNYDDLLKSFGIDKKKTTFEVEKYLGRKLQKAPEPQQPSNMAKAPVQNALPNMSDGDAFAFFNSLAQPKDPPV
jgi:hypothetical protein